MASRQQRAESTSRRGSRCVGKRRGRLTDLLLLRMDPSWSLMIDYQECCCWCLGFGVKIAGTFQNESRSFRGQCGRKSISIKQIIASLVYICLETVKDYRTQSAWCSSCRNTTCVPHASQDTNTYKLKQTSTPAPISFRKSFIPINTHL